MHYYVLLELKYYLNYINDYAFWQRVEILETARYIIMRWKRIFSQVQAGPAKLFLQKADAKIHRLTLYYILYYIM